MKREKSKIKKSLIIGLVIILVGSFLFFSGDTSKQSYSIDIRGTGLTVNEPNRESQDLNVLVIEINPIINSITNYSLYPNNNGHPKVSEYFRQDLNASLNEMVEDLEYTSHGYLNINIKNEYLNEYPTYTSNVTLNNGSIAHRLDEETYLAYSRKPGTDQGDWYKWIYSAKVQELSANSYTFDYQYIIDKYDLINRRNNGEFDQVWLLTIDPTSTYETIMIGNNPYWINAPGYVANCQNFLMANISISRRDANLHALGHGVEGIMRAAFHKSYSTFGDKTGLGTYKYYKASYSSYTKDNISINSVDEYNRLNLWEKFTLGIYSNTGNYTSVGNVHYPYNGTKDYDYRNTTKVYTNWRDWLNYPNIPGNFILDNNNAWLTNAGNNTLGSNENKDPDRLYTRFWFYLMPHITGYTEDGYSNNWWKYFYSLDFVSKIQANGSTNIKVQLGNYVPINCSLIYNSEKIDTLSLIQEGNNIQISNQNVLGFKNGYVYAKSIGTSNVTLNYDGKSITYVVTVNDSKTFRITFDKNTASSISKTSDFCTTTRNSCNIIMPNITAPPGYKVVGWSPSKTSTSTIYTPNKIYSISNNMTLYAIVQKIPTTTYTITFNKNKALSIETSELSCSTINNRCEITMPNIIPNSGENIVGWSLSPSDTTAIYLPGITYTISNNMQLYAITSKEISIKKFTITFDKNTALEISNTALSCTTMGVSCEITMPTITPNSGYEVVGWSKEKNATEAIYLQDKSYSISENMTLYAILKESSEGTQPEIPGEPQLEISGVTVKTSNTLTGNCVPNAELVIQDSNNNIVDKWTSTCESENIYHQIILPDGDYTLSETITPLGYATPSKVTFTIKDNKIPAPLNMQFAPIQLCISKTTGNKKSDMLETEYKMYDESGKIVENFVLTDTKKCFLYTPIGSYTIKEIPKQTERITSTDDLTIKIQDTSKVQEFTIRSEIIEAKKSKNNSTKIIIIACIFIIIGLGTIGWFYYKKRKISK